MNANVCAREDELLDALGRGYVGAELTSHVNGCEPCRELRLVAGALLEEKAAAMIEAPVPSASTMWWRMQIRYRQEVQTKARRSLVFGQALSLAAAMGLAIAFFGADMAVEIQEAVAAIRLSTPLLLAAATTALLAPIAGYVAARQK